MEKKSPQVGVLWSHAALAGSAKRGSRSAREKPNRHARETAASHAAATASAGADRRLVTRFRELAKKWQSETAVLSSVTQMAMHPAYQQIIGMGPAVIPVLLGELQRDPDHWFWALNAITGADPVPERSRGDLAAMAQAWIRWGKKHGHVA